MTCEAIDAAGVEAFLVQIQEELAQQTSRPLRLRKVRIPKEGGTRQLSMPAIRARVVQGARQLILEPSFEADGQPGSSGDRPKTSAHDASQRVAEALLAGKTDVRDLDRRAYVETVRHHTALVRTRQPRFRRHRSEPLTGVIAALNPSWRGWVPYVAFGHSSQCGSSVRRGVEQRVRRHLATARTRPGCGWKRGRSRWLSATMGLFDASRVTSRPSTNAAPVRCVPSPVSRRVQERVVRDIRRRRAMGRELDTWPWWHGEPNGPSKEPVWQPFTYRARTSSRPYRVAMDPSPN